MSLKLSIATVLILCSDRDRPKHRNLLRRVAISYELLRSVTIREKLPGPINYEAMRITRDRIRSDTCKCDETR